MWSRRSLSASSRNGSRSASLNFRHLIKFSYYNDFFNSRAWAREMKWIIMRKDTVVCTGFSRKIELFLINFDPSPACQRVYTHSYWLTIFCTTNGKQVLAKERWQNFENYCKKDALLPEHPATYINVHPTCSILLPNVVLNDSKTCSISQYEIIHKEAKYYLAPRVWEICALWSLKLYS